MSEHARTTWLINGLLAIILVLLAAQYLSVTRRAQAAVGGGGGWETDGVMAMTSSGPQERLVLVDTKKQSIMLYKPQNSGLFRLVGARSYQYDVEIEDSDKTIKGTGITFHEAKTIYDATKK